MEGVVNEEALEKLDKKKSDHKLILSSFRDEFDNLYKKEKHLKSEMKIKKKNLNNMVNFREIFKNSLTNEEKQIFNIKE